MKCDVKRVVMHAEDSVQVQQRRQEMPAISGRTKWAKVFPGILQDNNFKILGSDESYHSMCMSLSYGFKFGSRLWL